MSRQRIIVIPPLRKKRPGEKRIDPDSLTAALHSDIVADPERKMVDPQPGDSILELVKRAKMQVGE